MDIGGLREQRASKTGPRRRRSGSIFHYSANRSGQSGAEESDRRFDRGGRQKICTQRMGYVGQAILLYPDSSL